jgi:hypothetical protein
MAATFTALETIYERLAVAIDAAGPDKSQVFLAKLALMLSREIEDPKTVMAAIDACLKDL